MITTFEPTSSLNDVYASVDLEDLLALYLEANLETRLNILLNHPLVCGFVDIIDGLARRLKSQ